MLKKFGLGAIVLAAMFLAAGIVMAQGPATDVKATTNTTMKSAPATTMTTTTTTTVTPAAVNVGNKVCPVSGDKISDPGANTVEYQGKIYNLCCPMCKDKFLADPAKYVAIVEKELAEEKGETTVTEQKEQKDTKDTGMDMKM